MVNMRQSTLTVDWVRREEKKITSSWALMTYANSSKELATDSSTQRSFKTLFLNYFTRSVLTLFAAKIYQNVKKLKFNIHLKLSPVEQDFMANMYFFIFNYIGSSAVRPDQNI
jgi:hypothetical protein